MDGRIVAPLPDARDERMDTTPDWLADAGLIKVITDADGRESCKLAPEGARVLRQLAMTDEAGQDALLAALSNRASLLRGLE